MAECEEELKALLMKLNDESEKAGLKGLSWWLSVKNSPANSTGMGLIPGSGISPREENGNPL